jgi:hypothetical protein
LTLLNSYFIFYSFHFPQQPAPYPATTVPSVRLPLFLRRQFTRQDHGQGPMRFRVQPIQSAAANPQQQQQPGTSSSTSTASTSASTAAKTFDLSNAALASFFGQLLSNLGKVNQFCAAVYNNSSKIETTFDDFNIKLKSGLLAIK